MSLGGRERGLREKVSDQDYAAAARLHYQEAK